jgi:hypothetical protein
VDGREGKTKAILATGGERSTNRNAARMVASLAWLEAKTVEGKTTINKRTLKDLRIL